MRREGDTIEAVEADLLRARKVAHDFADAVRAHFGTRVRAVRLYGSAARGDWTPESDIDVLVLLDELRTTDRQWLAQCALDLGLLQHALLLQPLPMTERDFGTLRQRQRRFALDVDQEGLSL
ncbi:MAG: hypothetical protein A3K19_04740 [Lentisphaerae bacterium RIFOXYB12_FULL_65_16]|nr:MAG: hypothetical protein A3K18_11480 [Lentisphaerae bacterium RIFOXYA12_64_32]OGV84038.1 MAG: hypothetical protein A3K19_04740 [Lentisphaerae bacterium RIFOXYB12_FULL_65_16]